MMFIIILNEKLKRAQPPPPYFLVPNNRSPHVQLGCKAKQGLNLDKVGCYCLPTT